MQKKITSQFFARGAKLAKMAAEVGAKSITYKISQMVSENKDGSRLNRLLFDQATLLATELGQLKGSVMKVGQMLSVYGENFLPPEVNKILKNLQFSSPALPWEKIREVLTAELGDSWESELKLDPVPVGTASIGQVYKGNIIATGETIALKVQYPGIEKAIESDLKIFKRLLNVAEFFPQISHLDQLFDEVSRMFRQELDYRQELARMDQFREHLKNHPHIVVPKTYPKFSTDKVLTMSFEEGLPVDSDEVKGLSQDRRNHLAHLSLDLFFNELFVWRSVQTDPHLGNYRVRIGTEGEKDCLVLFDFGAVRDFPEVFVENYKNMVKATLDQDEKKILQAAKKLDFVADDDPEILKRIFVEFCIATVEPYVVSESGQKFMDSEGQYMWRESDLPKRITSKIGELKQCFKLRSPPQEVVFLDRKISGVYIFLSVLGAVWTPKDLLESYLQRLPQ